MVSDLQTSVLEGSEQLLRNVTDPGLPVPTIFPAPVFVQSWLFAVKRAHVHSPRTRVDSIQVHVTLQDICGQAKRIIQLCLS